MEPIVYKLPCEVINQRSLGAGNKTIVQLGGDPVSNDLAKVEITLPRFNNLDNEFQIDKYYKITIESYTEEESPNEY